ncbi:MAG: DUF5123 domain-containing protein [Acidimicrobiales bacterium]
MTPRVRPSVVVAVLTGVLVAGVAAVTIVSLDEPTSSDPSPVQTTDEQVADTSSTSNLPSRTEELVVSPSGDDDDPGTSEAPFATLQHALEQLRPGDSLIVEDGTYREQIRLPGDVLRPGTHDAPIEVSASPGARPVIEGRLSLTGADHWTIRGVNVTWSSDNSDDDHMVQFLGGTGWRFTEAEVWGAESFSAINVDEGATDFRLDHLYVHDTVPTNDENQDHLIYVASGNEGGVIERNVLAGSPNGRGVKVGPGSSDEPGSNRIVIRYNTFYDNGGPSNVRFSGDSSGNVVYRNIMVRPDDGEAAVTAFELNGSGNSARDNVYWEATDGVDEEAGLTDGGGNIELDPGFVDPGSGDFTVTTAGAMAYGALGDGPP